MARAPLSGTISMNDVNNALGLASPYNQTISLNDSAVRALLGRSSGAIALSDAYGKPVPPANLPVSATTHVQNLNIYNWAVSAGWDKSVKVDFTINSGVYVWSDSTGVAALTTGGVFPNGLTITNNGYIMGKGGDGATYNSGTPLDPTAGGPAINLTTNCSIVNNGYIGGGGGGGKPNGAGLAGGCGYAYAGGGGGAGGGNGGTSRNISPEIAGGAGGAIGQAGSNGTKSTSGIARTGAGGGGRIMPGTGGTPNGTGGGAGGAGGAALLYDNCNVATVGAVGGGGGGGWGASGSNPPTASGSTNNAGGAAGAAAGDGAGAAGGKAIERNGVYTATISGAGIMYGGNS